LALFVKLKLGGDMSIIELLTIATATILGLFAGGMLTEALLLVPYFRSLKAEDFYRQRHDFGPRLYRFYSPLTIGATLSALTTAIAVIVLDPKNSGPSLIAALLSLSILSTYFLYFRRANRSFAEQRLTATELNLELGRWSGVHNFRTALAIAAALVSILAAIKVASS
jgi:uncharacterized membrane protein